MTDTEPRLRSVNIQHPGSMSFLDEITVDASDVTVSGDYAYLGSGTALQIVSVRDPANLTLLAPFATQGLARHAAVAGDYAFVADGSRGLQVVAVRQRMVDPTREIGRSTRVTWRDLPVMSVRIQTSQTSTVDWMVRADPGAAWQPIQPDWNWYDLSGPGSDLVWTTEHLYTQPTVNPGVSDLEMQWHYEPAIIAEIEDVPNDQGRQVSVVWERSHYDFLDSVAPILGYEIYRRWPDDERQFVARAEPDHELRSQGPLSGIALDGWYYVMMVPAHGEETYSTVVPTLEDVTPATFLVRAATANPLVFWDSPPEDGFSVDNLAPSAPGGLQLVGMDLTWDDSPEPDLAHYTVYAGDVGDPAAATLIGTTGSPTKDISSDFMPWYFVTASDFAGNESAPSSLQNPAVDAPTPGTVPTTWALRGGRPNPFRDATRLAFDLPERASVRLVVYDVQGRLVKTVVNGAREAGSYRETWSGRDEAGVPISPGVYFVRIEAGKFSATERIVRLN